MSGEKITMFKKIRASLCHHCPLCNHARKNPDSRIGKILHHKYHSDNCPLWKAEIEVYGCDHTEQPGLVLEKQGSVLDATMEEPSSTKKVINQPAADRENKTPGVPGKPVIRFYQ